MTTNRNEQLGPAERVINALVSHQDHMFHGRPGLVCINTKNSPPVEWKPVTHKLEGTVKVVYHKVKQGKKSVDVRLGILADDKRVLNGTTLVGTFRDPGLFPEVVAWTYKQIADVYKLDNEFAARWASYAFTQEHRDLKVALAAFMLVQPRKGDPVVDAGKVAFYDADYRDIGEAMLLLYKTKDGSEGLKPNLLLRIHDLLILPEIAAINRELGFTQSNRKPFLGRWPRVVEKWLRYREDNPKILEGLIKAGFRKTVMRLAQTVGYKPSTPKFFELLRWKQKQADDGRRTLAIGEAVKAADSWAKLNEKQICERIVKTKPDWKRITGLLPAKVGITAAIVAAAIEAGCLSDKDLVILTPTLEELGLLNVAPIKAKWEKAVNNANDMRAANIARNVRSVEVKQTLEIGADKALQKAVEEVIKGIVLYLIVDISGSMKDAIEQAKALLAKFVQGFPLNKLHVAAFNTAGREIKIQHASAAGVTNAFVGITAGGGTDYGAGVRAVAGHKPAPDEDAIMLFVGDEEAPGFEMAVRTSGLNPVAFGLLKVMPNSGAAGYRAAKWGTDKNDAVRSTAAKLGIPCFELAEEIFADPYAIPRTMRNVIAATPVTAAAVNAPIKARVSLIDTILSTKLLAKPEWA